MNFLLQQERFFRKRSRLYGYSALVFAFATTYMIYTQNLWGFATASIAVWCGIWSDQCREMAWSYKKQDIKTKLTKARINK